MSLKMTSRMTCRRRNRERRRSPMPAPRSTLDKKGAKKPLHASSLDAPRSPEGFDFRRYSRSYDRAGSRAHLDAMLVPYRRGCPSLTVGVRCGMPRPIPVVIRGKALTPNPDCNGEDMLTIWLPQAPSSERRFYGLARWARSFSFSLQMDSRTSLSGTRSKVTLIVNGLVYILGSSTVMLKSMWPKSRRWKRS